MKDVLSIIDKGVCDWKADYSKYIIKNIPFIILGKGELDWIAEYSKKQEMEETMKKSIAEQELLVKQQSKSKEIHNKYVKKKRKRSQADDEFDELMKGASTEVREAFKAEINQLDKDDDVKQDDNDIILEDYHSDNDANEKEDANVDEDETVHVTKIYYCSRTHSQLSQFVREIIKSPYGDNVRVTTLGSRQNLCINDKVLNLKSINLINESCLDMQKNKTEKQESDCEQKHKRRKKAATKCPYYKSELLNDLKDQILADVMDVEQLVTEGNSVCMYIIIS